MSASHGRLAPAEFVAKLASGGLEAPLTFVGMVKEAGDAEHLQFASGTSCERWVEIPLDMVEHVEHLGTVPCRDHAHPLAQLALKEPTTPEARVFAGLARTRAGGGGAGPGGRAPQPGALAATPSFATHSRASCAGCFRFWQGVIPNPEFQDFLFVLNFCEGVCEG